MKYHSYFIALGLLIAGLGETPAIAQQASMNAADVAKIQADVGAAASTWVKTFSSRDIPAIVAKWANPAIQFEPNGIKLLTPADLEANYKKTFVELAKTPFDHSEDLGHVVCVMSPTMAISSDHFRRIAKDGSVILEGYGHYLYTKKADGWRMTAAIPTPLKNMNCN